MYTSLLCQLLESASRTKPIKLMKMNKVFECVLKCLVRRNREQLVLLTLALVLEWSLPLELQVKICVH